MWYVAACRAFNVLIVLQVAGERYAKSSFTYHAKDDEGF